MFEYLLECKYVPFSFEKEHADLSFEFENFRKIWKTVFRTPYLNIRGFQERRCLGSYTKVYRKWKNYLKMRIKHIRALYLTEAIAKCINNERHISLFSIIKLENKNLEKYLAEKIKSSYWIKEYNSKFSITRKQEEK